MQQLDPQHDGWPEKVRASFARQSLMMLFGAEIVDLAPGRVTLGAPITPDVLQQHGVAHAAFGFALGDTAAGYAALTLMGAEDEVMTAEIKTNLLAPAAGDRMEAVGEVVRLGRRLIVVTASLRVHGAKGWRDVALMQGTMVPVPAG